jgi:hypothetical protein
MDHTAQYTNITQGEGVQGKTGTIVYALKELNYVYDYVHVYN